MIKLHKGLLFEVRDEPSDEIDPPVPPDTSDYDRMKLELMEAKKEARALNMLLAAKSAEIRRLGGSQ